MHKIKHHKIIDLASQMQGCVCLHSYLDFIYFSFFIISEGPCLQKLYTVSLGVVSCWLPKWVWAGKHAFPCSDCVVVVVSVALKIKEHPVLRGRAHVEETHPCLIYIQKTMCTVLMEPHRSICLQECMHLAKCTVVYAHQHACIDTHHSISFKWGISSHGNHISSCWSRGMCWGALI